jgi:hypothetical protein
MSARSPRRRTTLTLAVIAALAAALGSAAPSDAGSKRSSSIFYEKVDGFLQGYPGNCPPAEAPQNPFVCHETILSAFRVGGTDTTKAPPKATWVLSVVSHTLTFPGGGADPTESDEVTGFSETPVVTFDQQHLSGGHVIADDVPMSDGSTLDVDATWTATSPRMQYGNDGPSLLDFGLVRHDHEKCLNAVNQGHQKFRLAHVAALLNGVPTNDNSIFAFIAYNHFISIEVHPASCR